MRARVTDSVALKQISPVLLNKYLEIQGWKREETWRERIVVWSKENGGSVKQALVGLLEESEAYATRIAETLQTLEESEDRSQLEIYSDVLGAGADIVSLRSANDNRQRDWSLAAGADIMNRARDLMMASARIAERPGSPVYAGRMTAKVQNYVRELRTLPVGESWDTLTIHSPVSPDFGVQGGFTRDSDPPFSRRVIETLGASLNEASKAVHTVLGNNDLTTFENAATRGVSANLCEAVADLVHQNRGLQVGIAWAPIRAGVSHGGTFQFSESAAEALYGGAEFLRKEHPVPDVFVQGEIVQLERQAQEDFDGVSVVVGEVDDRWMRLDVQFDKEDREEVVRAFSEKLLISITGDVFKRGRQYELRNPANLRILGANGQDN